jgi:hypothetical protein
VSEVWINLPSLRWNVVCGSYHAHGIHEGDYCSILTNNIYGCNI